MAPDPAVDPETTALLEQGLTAYRSGDRRRARQLLTAVTQRDPRSEVAWLWLSAAHDDVAFKRICLQKVLAINPGNPNAKRGLALLEGTVKTTPSLFSPPTEPPAPEPSIRSTGTLRARPVEAVLPHCPWCGAEFTRALSNHCPKCGRPLELDCPTCDFHVPLEVEECPRCGAVRGSFQADRQGYLARLGTAYHAKGWVELALSVYGYLLEIEPLQADYHFQEAQLYDQVGDTVRAVNAYRRALELDPENLEALTHLARWYLSLHQTPDLVDIARQLQQRLTHKSISNRLALTVLLADVEFELDHSKEARRLYEELIRFPQLDLADRARANFRLGELYREQNDLDRAVRAYTASLARGGAPDVVAAAQQQLDRLQPPVPPRTLRSHLELLRAMAGPLLLVSLLAGLQAGLQAERFTRVDGLGWLVACLGSYLAASAWVTPLTAEWRLLLGPTGLTRPIIRPAVAAAGVGLLAVALALVFAG